MASAERWSSPCVPSRKLASACRPVQFLCVLPFLLLLFLLQRVSVCDGRLVIINGQDGYGVIINGQEGDVDVNEPQEEVVAMKLLADWWRAELRRRRRRRGGGGNSAGRAVSFSDAGGGPEGGFGSFLRPDSSSLLLEEDNTADYYSSRSSGSHQHRSSSSSSSTRSTRERPAVGGAAVPIGWETDAGAEDGYGGRSPLHLRRAAAAASSIRGVIVFQADDETVVPGPDSVPLSHGDAGDHSGRRLVDGAAATTATTGRTPVRILAGGKGSVGGRERIRMAAGEVGGGGGGEGGGNPGIALTLTQKGLTYTKEVLVGQVLKDVIPLHVPEFKARSSSEFGEADAIVRNIVVSSLDVPESAVDLSAGSITIFAAGIRAHVSLNWKYSLSNTYFPIPIGDEGTADISLRGMQSGVTFNLTQWNGTLAVSVLECGSFIEDLHIDMHGRISWLYNWFIRSFSAKIKTAVEQALTKGVIASVGKLDTYVQGLPRQLPIDDVAAVDVTIVSDPTMKPDYLSVGTRGEFVRVGGGGNATGGGGGGGGSVRHWEPSRLATACGEEEKMVTMALSEFVLNSASVVYHASGSFHWSVDELPDKSPIRLNTSSWRFMLPQLYLKYPNRAIKLDVRVVSPPNVSLTEEGIKAEVNTELTIQVAPATKMVDLEEAEEEEEKGGEVYAAEGRGGGGGGVMKRTRRRRRRRREEDGRTEVEGGGAGEVISGKSMMMTKRRRRRRVGGVRAGLGGVGGDALSVACLEMTVAIEGVAEINGNNITGRASLDDLKLRQKWSDIGKIPVSMIQALVRTVVKGIIVPTMNFHLKEGFPLPIIPGVTLQNAVVKYAEQSLLVCTDAQYVGENRNNNQSPPPAPPLPQDILRRTVAAIRPLLSSW